MRAPEQQKRAPEAATRSLRAGSPGLSDRGRGPANPGGGAQTRNPWASFQERTPRPALNARTSRRYQVRDVPTVWNEP
jgi:hypothetical protein